MIIFLSHKKFWLPLVLVILVAVILEILLRRGLWDAYIKPNSYLGNVIYREKAIQEFGLDKVEWITVGDSKTDWGIEHGKVLNIKKINGINHLRMSFESSNFMALQATIDWSIAKMPNLQGIMIGLSEDNFGHFSDIKKQYNVAWPFRDFFDYNKYVYFDNVSKLQSWHNRQALKIYFDDIKYFTSNIYSQLKATEKYLRGRYSTIFTYNRNLFGDICSYPLATLKQCIATVQNIQMKTGELTGNERFIVNQCGNNYARERAFNNLPFFSLSNQKKQILINNWQQLFKGVLNQGIKLKVVLMPEHPMFDYNIKPVNTYEIARAVIDEGIANDNFELLDIRNIFRLNSSDKQCSFYHDPLHFNNKGKALITEKIIESFKLNIASVPKSDNINKNGFE